MLARNSLVLLTFLARLEWFRIRNGYAPSRIRVDADTFVALAHAVHAQADRTVLSIERVRIEFRKAQ